MVDAPADHDDLDQNTESICAVRLNVDSKTIFTWLIASTLLNTIWSPWLTRKNNSAIRDLIKFDRDAVSMSSGDDAYQFDLGNLEKNVRFYDSTLILRYITLALALATLIYGFCCGQSTRIAHEGNQAAANQRRLCCKLPNMNNLLIIALILLLSEALSFISTLIFFINTHFDGLQSDITSVLQDASELNENGLDRLQIKYDCCGFIVQSGSVSARNCPVTSKVPNCTDAIINSLLSVPLFIVILISDLVVLLLFVLSLCRRKRVPKKRQAAADQDVTAVTAGGQNEVFELQPIV